MQQFWNRVNVGREEDCWDWLGAPNNKGYGSMQWGGEVKGAHCIAFFLANGYWADNALHTCNRKSCCNPKHIYSGTNGNNLKDAYRDGLRASGEKHHYSKLTDNEVRLIRWWNEQEMFDDTTIARAMGVSRTQISRIRRGLSRGVSGSSAY